MPGFTVDFLPQNRRIRVEPGTTLLEATSMANITLNNLCGGDGICGRCKMIVRQGDAGRSVSAKLTREEIQKGYVLACQLQIYDDLVVEVPEETFAREKLIADEDAERFESGDREFELRPGVEPTPVVRKLFLELDPPTLADNSADHQRLVDAVRRRIGTSSVQTGLKIVASLHDVLRDSGYRVTATIGERSNTYEIMNVEPGDTTERNYMVVVDIGTTTIVAHLVDANAVGTVDAKACFNSGAVYGREVTGRMMAAEKRGIHKLQALLVTDINQLIVRLVEGNGISLRDITVVVCAGNTVMSHFLLGLPTESIRRAPYVPLTVEPSPFRAVEVGIEINPRGLLYSLPGISGWVGSDITAGILATRINESGELSLLIDIGTNGEIVIGNREWLISASASAGPALEGASEQCGMRAEGGAIERVSVVDGDLAYQTIGDKPPKGICGSGIIDLVAKLLEAGIINRSGMMQNGSSDRVERIDGIGRYVLVRKEESRIRKEIFITETDIENVITAKAAIFAAMRILLERLDMEFADIDHFYLAGSFGSYLDIESATAIGLIPNVDRERIEFVGNTSVWGAKIAAFYREARNELDRIRRDTTYYDLMGAADYVEEFQKAMFLPHTDIELFTGAERTERIIHVD